MVKEIFYWIKTWKCTPVWSWVRATYLFKQGLYKEASFYYKKGIQNNPNHKALFCAYTDLAQCLIELGKYEEAERYLLKVTLSLRSSYTARIRLARLQLWLGQPADAAWTLYRGLKEHSHRPDYVGLYLYSVLEGGGASYLLRSAAAAANKLKSANIESPLLKTALAKFSIERGKRELGVHILTTLVEEGGDKAPVEALFTLAEELLKDGQTAQAKRYLRRALLISPNCPRALSLLAQLYLKSGPFYSPEYAVQLATTACKYCGWLSARELHILAEAFYHTGDQLMALAVASKARLRGRSLSGGYRDLDQLEKLIESLKETVNPRRSN
ncbi:MAG: hypothetical protein D6780_07235 [Candidatus Dadabacteria bacterium]|nr:MAG: hypothetical protein D6780_07235 [Candidatus Dadabacteria bacterium]